MTGWRVDPAGVQAIARASLDAHPPLVATIDAVETDLITAINGSCSAAVLDAVTAFLEAETPDVTVLRHRVPAAVAGLVAASNAILAGDYEMAAETQRLAMATGGPASTGRSDLMGAV